MDYCDVLISCLDSHSDGTHSLQSIHCWESHVMLHFFTSFQNNKLIHLYFHFWVKYSFNHWCSCGNGTHRAFLWLADDAPSEFPHLDWARSLNQNSPVLDAAAGRSAHTAQWWSALAGWRRAAPSPALASYRSTYRAPPYTPLNRGKWVQNWVLTSPCHADWYWARHTTARRPRARG